LLAAVGTRTGPAVFARITFALLVVLSAVAGAGIAAAQDDRPTVAIVGATVGDSATVTLQVALTVAPEGLAGYYLRVSVADPEVARIEAASYPDSFGMTTDPAVAPDGASVTLEAADVDGAIEPGASDVTLATVTVSGVAPGEAQLSVEPLQFDADGGALMDPATRADAVTVTPGSPETGGDGAAVSGEPPAATGVADGNDATGDDATGGLPDAAPPLVVTAAAVGLVVAGLAIGRRL
jgi:hypothetical protein